MIKKIGLMILILNFTLIFPVYGGATVITCHKNGEHKTGNPNFVDDHAYEISAHLECDRALPSAKVSFREAKKISRDNTCVSRVRSIAKHRSFVIGHDEIISRHDIEAASLGGVKVIAHKKCLVRDCRSFLGGCFCERYTDAPELGFKLVVNGLVVETNKTKDLSQRHLKITRLNFNGVEIVNGEESVTKNGKILYQGEPLRNKYSPVNFDIGEDAKNTSYKIRRLNFNKENCRY